MTDLDQLYVTWMTAESDEQAALVLLGLNDDVEHRALAEVASEKRTAAEAAYREALGTAARSSGVPASA